MSLRKKLKLTWQGKEYALAMTMEVIDSIDELINISSLFYGESVNDVRITKKAKLIAIVLNEAGASTTQEEVYTELYNEDHAAVNALYSSILWAFIPEQKKKDQEPAQK